MTAKSRRCFLKDTALVTAAALASSKTRADNIAQRVRIGVIGCGNQGTNHIRSLAGLNDSQIVHVADIDQERLAKAVTASGGANGVSDFRRILDDRSVDAVTIATPDHWHVPVAL